MILGTPDLDCHAGAVTMVDGGFDPLHAGHVGYFAAAAELGLPVLCNVTCDAWVRRKHRVLLSQQERATVIDAIRYVDLVHAGDGTTGEVLRRLRPRFYAKGEDWRGRLPDEELRICEEFGIEVVYLDTVVASSSAILERYDARTSEPAA